MKQIFLSIIFLVILLPYHLQAQEDMKAKKYYMMAKSSLKKGEDSYEEAKELLNRSLANNEVNLTTLREIVKEKKISLATFFDTLSQKYNDKDFETVKILFRGAAINFASAYDNITKAIEISPAFVDAHLKQCAIALKMGWDKKAVSSFEQAEKRSFKPLTELDPFQPEVQRIFFHIAEVGLKFPELFEKTEEEVERRIIGEWIELRAKAIEEKGEKAAEKFKNEILLGKFALAYFYQEQGMKEEAEKELGKVLDEVEEEMGMEGYDRAKEEIKILAYKISILMRKETMEFSVDKKLIDDFGSDVSIEILSASAEVATAKDLNIFLLPTGFEVGLKSDFEKKKCISAAPKLIPGEYTIFLELSNLEIEEENIIPFKIEMECKGWSEPQPLAPELFLSVVGTDGEPKGEPLHFQQNEYVIHLKEASLMDIQTMTRQEIPKGFLKVTMIQHQFKLKEGQDYKVLISRHSQKDWWDPFEKVRVKGIVIGGSGLMGLMLVIFRFL